MLIYLKSRTNSKGECQIYLRLTVDSKRKELSLNRSIDPKRWDKKRQRGKGNTEAILSLNKSLISIENKVHQSEQELVNKGLKLSVENLANQFTGIEEKSYNLIEVFEYENARIKKCVEIGTYKKYVAVLNNVKKYLLFQYKVSDIDIKCIDFQFVTDFDYFLRTERKISNNSAIRVVKTLQQIVKTTVDKGWLIKDPFANYKVRMEKKITGYLTKDEIDTIYNKKFSIKRLEQVKDVFIVSCYTGLAYVDVHLLNKNDIVTNLDGTSWISINRKKTNTICKIPILPLVAEIFDKYKDDPLVLNSEKLLPVPSNQKMNAYLKEIGDICSIKTNLTSHLARHSFATSIALPNGLPIETLSKIMGHKSLNMTLHYGKLIETKLISDVANFRDKLSKSNSTSNYLVSDAV